MKQTPPVVWSISSGLEWFALGQISTLSSRCVGFLYCGTKKCLSSTAHTKNFLLPHWNSKFSIKTSINCKLLFRQEGWFCINLMWHPSCPTSICPIRFVGFFLLLGIWRSPGPSNYRFSFCKHTDSQRISDFHFKLRQQVCSFAVSPLKKKENWLW